MAEEIDHLLLLSIITITFVVCSLPFTVSANASPPHDHDWDLLALRFLSVNSIVDPWVFAILRPPFLRLLRSALRCRPALPSRGGQRSPAGAKAKPALQLAVCGR
uniref:Prostaglandin E2 receptor EP2 subtype n=1 Tax=Dromaius novaehollandiae TaxID=8790 RepID=A0A8C4KGC6_DRONO